MPVIRVNQQGDALALHRSPAPAGAALERAARAGKGPVIAMVHGFKFRPGAGGHCPHEHIFALEDAACRKALSWPRGLGFGAGAAEEGPDTGLGLAFGWDSKGMIWNAYEGAATAGAALARAIRRIRAAAPERPVHAIGHSLGARVILQALPHLAPGDLGRIVALNPAEFRGAAAAALDTPAGRYAELIAVTGRENAGYDLLLERFVAPERRGDRALGWGLPDGMRRAAILRLDHAPVAAHLERLGFPLAPERRIMCHWSPYLRGGAMAFYAALMREAHRLPLDRLTPPAEARPEESRGTRGLFPPLLPWGRNAPS